ncbi:MAG: hypothetical protein HY820_33290 [Acidobacteria bacterium]|nr:hypothetical protein [Acidobacteriota bacterium]
MHSSILMLLATCLLVGTASVNAVPIVRISFDQLQNGEDVLNYYSGGFGSLGSGPGPGLSTAFGAGWIVGPPDVYSLPGGKSAGLSSTATMNVPGGFTGWFSFYYSGAPLTVDFFSGQNGSGFLVGSMPLAGEAQFATAGWWSPGFQSAVFQSSGNRIDAVTFGELVIPEPMSYQYVVLGLGLLAGVRARGTIRRSGILP